MTSMQRAIPAVLLCTLGVLAGCGGDEPTAPPEPSFIFDPAERALIRGALEPVVLQVRADDGSAASATFWVDGVEVAQGSSYTWPSNLPGTHELKAVVAHNGRTISATWQVEVSDAGALPTPPVTEVAATTGPIPGSIQLVWEAPPASLYTIPLREYAVALASEPILDDSAAGVQVIVVPHQGASIQHELQQDGLQERARYYFRVRVTDQFGRSSLLSPEVSSEATGHYDVQGTVFGIRVGSAKAPLEEVLVAMGQNHKDYTASDGRFRLLNLPDTFESTLSIQDSRSEFYSVLYPRLAPVSWDRETLLLERGVVHVIDDVEERDLSRLRFFKEFTQKHLANARPFFRWGSYPVHVHTPELVIQGVDYRQAFLDAIDNWNAAAGETLLQAVESFDPVIDTGANYVVNLPQGGHILGHTDIVDPANQGLRDAVPRLITVELTTFSSQQVANLIISHEVGHVLLLGHSPSDTHLMRSDPQIGMSLIPTPDEGYFARLVSHLPQGTDLSTYLEPTAAQSDSR